MNLSVFVNVYMIMVGWLPAWFQVFVFAFFSVLGLIIVLKIVALVLDAIPFV